MTVPANYRIEDHLGRLFSSPAFAAAAKETNQNENTIGNFRRELNNELKQVVAAERDQEVAEFEQRVGQLALAKATAKAKGRL